jgi:threonine/homoserine/homoserine lactone efflux protein
MVAYLILGATYAFAAAVQPGPLQAYLVSQALRNGWRRTVPAALAPLVSDGPIILLVLLVLTRLPPRVELLLRLAGGVFLVYLAVNAWKAWRDYQASRPSVEASAKRSVLSAALVNLLNPNPYLGWTLVLGPLLLQGWRERPAHAVALLVGFYGTMVVTVAGIITLFAGAGSLGPRIGRALVGASAVALACFGGYQLWVGVKALMSP